MISLERRTLPEFITRHLLILSLVLLGAWIYSLVFPLLWFLAYAATSFCTILLLRQLSRTRLFPTYLTVLAVYGIRILTYRAMVIYLWLYPELVAQFIALFMYMSTWRFSINQKSRIRSYALLTAFGDLMTLTVLSGAAFLAGPTEPTNILISASTAALGVYYVVTLRQAHRGLLEIEALEDQWRQSQKMEAIGRLTGGVAHDFNNILTVVIGNLELYDEVADPAEKSDLVRRARAAAERASMLTAQLLAFSRQSPMTLERVETPAFLAKLGELTERVLPASIHLNVHTNTTTWPMYVDRVQLEVALLNLIINARDAMPDGGQITLTAMNHVQTDLDKLDERYVCIELVDEGEGIPRDILSKVTEPFFTTKTVGKGSGLGLSMVKGFAEQSGGKLEIESVLGAGTRVSMLIPSIQH